MTDQDFLNIPIQTILPQQEPFIMVSQMLHYDDVFTLTRLLVTADNIFCHDGHLVASGLVENIAQTCAARIGYINKFILHKDVSIGFIGAIRNLEIHQLPQVGQTIETRIEVVNESFGLTLARGEIRLSDGKIIAEGEMKIALSEQTV